MPRARAFRTAVPVVSVAALLVPLLSGCGGSDSGSSGGKDKVKLTVLAASSLTDVLPKAAKAYEKSHSGTTLRFSFAGSQDLVSQVRGGDPADALITADTTTMHSVKSDTEKPTVIAKNRLTIVTDRGNPDHVKSLSDLSRSGLKVVLAAPSVPVGRYSKQVLDQQHIKVKPVSQEANVRAVLSKVELGEADAGVVYVTDAAVAKNKVTTVAVPDAQNAIASYPAAAVKGSKHAKQAASFVKWLSSAQAQKYLRDAGFQRP